MQSLVAVELGETGPSRLRLAGLFGHRICVELVSAGVE